MKGRRIPTKEETIPPASRQQPLTWEMLRNAAKMSAGVPYTAIHRLVSLPVTQQLYDAAPPEWKPLLVVMEKMPELTPVERDVLTRYQDKRARR